MRKNSEGKLNDRLTPSVSDLYITKVLAQGGLWHSSLNKATGIVSRKRVGIIIKISVRFFLSYHLEFLEIFSWNYYRAVISIFMKLSEGFWMGFQLEFSWNLYWNFLGKISFYWGYQLKLLWGYQMDIFRILVVNYYGVIS